METGHRKQHDARGSTGDVDGSIPAQVLVPGQQLDPYQIVALIGAGGMGQVYRATDPRLGREVALKILTRALAGHPEAILRFHTEVRAASLLQHPNLVTVHDTGTHEGRPFVVTELLQGEDLADRLARGRLSIRKAVDIGVQVCRGLAAAHDQGIVHRDLKPANIFVTRTGRVRILDFGLAKLLPQALPPSLDSSFTTEAPPTHPGTVLGTVGYMPPEHVRGLPGDERSDIFSVGVVLYELLAGCRPFRGDSSVEVMNTILHHDPEDLDARIPEIPLPLARIVGRCLEKEPDARYQSARDLAFDLAMLSGIGTGEHGTLPGGSRAAPPRRPRRGMMAALAILLLGLGGWLIGEVSTTRAAQVAPPSEPTLQRVTYRRGTVNRARFTADGHSVVYDAAWEGAPTMIFEARLGSPVSRRLELGSALLLDVSSGNELALALDDDTAGGAGRKLLARAPLTGSSPRLVQRDVLTADYTHRDEELALVRRADGASQIEWPPGTVVHRSTGAICHLRVSPDGNRLAFIEHPNFLDDRGSVRWLDRGGTVRTLSDGWSALQGLAWHPMGSEVWFAGARAGTSRAIHAVTLTGEERLIRQDPGMLTLHDISSEGDVLMARESARLGVLGVGRSDAGPRELGWLDWSYLADLSDDGGTLLISESGEGGGEGYAIYLRPSDGADAMRVGQGMPLALSPDQGLVASYRVEHPQELVLLPTGPGRSRSFALTGISRLTGAAWLPDGRRLVLTATEEQRGDRALLFDTSTGTILTRSVVPAAPPIRISPDGARFTARSSDGFHLFNLEAENLSATPIPGLSVSDAPVQWTVDGRELWLVTGATLPLQLDRLDLESGDRVHVRELTLPDPTGVRAVPTVRITPDGSFLAFSYWRGLSDLYVLRGLS